MDAPLNWLGPISSVIGIIRAGIEVVKGILGEDEIVARDLTIQDIWERMKNGTLNVGDRVTCIGTFSRFLPFVDLRDLIEKETVSTTNMLCTCRLDSIMDTYCGALYMPYQTKATDGCFQNRISTWQRNPNPCIPLLYSKTPEVDLDKGLRLANCRTGDMPELTCEIRELPDDWKKIIAPKTHFCYHDSTGLARPFCLKVLDVKPYGTILDEFRIDVWIAGHMSAKAFKDYLKRDRLMRAKIFGKRLSTYMKKKKLTEAGWQVFKLVDKKDGFEQDIFWTFALHGPTFLAGLADINILDSNLLSFARTTVAKLIESDEAVVDFQYDQLNNICPQSISVADLLKNFKNTAQH